MPRINEPTILEHRQRTETALLDAWGTLIEELGPHEITLALVAGRAGIARNTIYGYFPDRDHLLLAHLEREVEHFVQSLTAAVDASAGAVARLNIIIEHLLDYFVAHPGIRHEPSGGKGGELHKQILACFEPIHRLISRVIRDGIHERVFRDIDPVIMAPLLLAIVSVYRAPVVSGTMPPATARQHVVEFLLGGIQADSLRTPTTPAV